MYANFIAMLVADILIASALVYFLHVSRTGIKRYVNFLYPPYAPWSYTFFRTEGLINLLITYTVNTGKLPLTVTVASIHCLTYIRRCPHCVGPRITDALLESLSFLSVPTPLPDWFSSVLLFVASNPH